MRDAGLSEDEIRHRIKKGLLIPEFRAVYRVGHRAPSFRSLYMAAVKACGERAVLWGLAAAYLLGIFKGPTPPPYVMAPTERRVDGLKPKRARKLDRRDVTRVGPIPCTTVPRTVVDLAAVLDDDALARLFHEANVKYGTTPQQIEAVLKRVGNGKGAAVLR